MNILYKTEAKASGGGRQGHSATADGNLSVTLTVPKEMGGPGGEGTNPEQLFAVGYAACFLGALRFAAGKEKIKVPDNTTVTSHVGIGPRDDGTGFGIDVSLAIDLPGMAKAEAEDLVAKAHIVCPYSDATRNSLNVKLSVV